MVRAGLRFVGVVYLAQVRSTYGLHAVYPICILAGSPHRFYSVHPRSIPRPVGPSSRPSMQHAETRLKRLSVEVISCLLVQRFDLEQVTLFSSSACAESDENSDLDLLVVRPVAQAARSMGPRIAGNTSKPSDPPRRDNPIHRAIADHFHLPADLLIVSHETFPRHRPNPNSMLSRMLEHSEVLYNRHAT